MRIAIDLRSLSSGSISGVENYCLNLVENLLALDKQNTYTLFYNSLSKNAPGEFEFINSKTVKTGYPNKILNLALKFNLVNLEKIAGDFDCLFMPNLNQFSILPKTKLAVTVHDLSPTVTPEFYDLKRRAWHKFLNYKKAFERADVIFAVSEYTKTDLMRLFNVPEKKVKVVYPGVDRKIFRPDIAVSELRDLRNRYELPGEFVLFLNTLEPRKNLSGLVRAFNLLKWDGHLVIAGKKGWKYRSILKELRGSPKFDKIKYIGYVPEQDKAALIKLSRCLVYPSFYEGFGFQPIEAMSLNVPVVAASVTALPEVVGDSAILVNPYNTAEIFRALQSIITDGNLRNSLLEKGFKRASQFSWQTTAQKVLESLNLLSSHK